MYAGACGKYIFTCTHVLIEVYRWCFSHTVVVCSGFVDVQSSLTVTLWLLYIHASSSSNVRLTFKKNKNNNVSQCSSLYFFINNVVHWQSGNAAVCLMTDP